MFIKIPTYSSDSDSWDYTEFETKQDYIDYVESQVKLPGLYGLKDTHLWRVPADTFRAKGRYCPFVKNSLSYIKYWETEKEKCRLTGGVIVDTQFIPGIMYFYINFIKINDKVKSKLDFPDIWDSDLHFFLYVLLCKLTGKHAIVVKARQRGYTLKHMAILINNLWFGESQINKILSYDSRYVKDAWGYLEDYRNFLNTHTGWTRNFNPDSVLNWQQRIEVNDGNKKVYRGNMSTIKGVTTEKSPTAGVGGKQDLVYIEEAGVNPTLDKTLAYLVPAVKLGNVVTGVIMASGSVGELSQCEPLKKIMEDPETYGFRSVENIWDEDKIGTRCGFFMPECWSYVGSIDEHGNSNVDLALEMIHQEREREKKKDPEGFRLYCSQQPLTLGEAFASRTESIFPLNRILRQIQRIHENRNYGQYVDLDVNEEGRIYHKPSNRLPVSDFPVKASTDKRGTIVMWEPPDQNPKWGTYFAGVDPVLEGRADSSVSLFSIYIYKNLVEESKEIDGEVRKELTGDKIVACWTGRYDDVNMTNEIAEMLIEYYNAYTVVEANVDSFIKHMIKKRKTKYLARKDDLPFLKEIQANRNYFGDYGVKMTTTVKTYILNTIIESLKEEIDIRRDKAGRELGKIYGAEKVPDLMLLKEMVDYHDKLNVDRLISYGLVLTFAKSRQANGLIIKREEVSKSKTDKNLYTPIKNPFKHIGGNYNKGGQSPGRNPFRNIG